MGTANDLISADLLQPPATAGGILVATILDLEPLRVTVDSLDRGQLARRAFGTPPDAAATGDEVRVQSDEYGSLVLVAWEPTP